MTTDKKVEQKKAREDALEKKKEAESALSDAEDKRGQAAEKRDAAKEKRAEAAKKQEAINLETDNLKKRYPKTFEKEYAKPNSCKELKKLEKELEELKQAAAKLEREAKSLDRAAAFYQIKAKVKMAVSIFQGATGKLFDPNNEFHVELLKEIAKELEMEQSDAQIEKCKTRVAELRGLAENEKNKDAADKLRQLADDIEKTVEFFKVETKVKNVVDIFNEATGKEFDPGNPAHVKLLLDIIKELEATKGFHAPEEETQPADIPEPESGK